VQAMEINYWALEEAWQLLMNSRIQYEENWQMARKQWRDLFYLISDKKYNDRMYGNGGGGGGGSSSGRAGTNESGNGVYAMNEKAKTAIEASVENDYKKYIKFDENGKVIIEIFDMNVIKILDNKPESNFAKLCALVYNAKEIYEVYGITKDETFCRRRLDNYEDSRSFSEYSDSELWGNEIGGWFVPANSKYYDIGQCCDRENPRNQIYLNISIDYQKIAGYAAHELYYHAYLYHLNQNYYDPQPYIRTPETKEYKNAYKKK